MILIPQCFQTISVQILESCSELRIKIAVFKNLFILKGRKSTLLFAKCYRQLLFLYRPAFCTPICMSSECDSEHYLDTHLHTLGCYREAAFLLPGLHPCSGPVTPVEIRLFLPQCFPTRAQDTWVLGRQAPGRALLGPDPLWV